MKKLAAALLLIPILAACGQKTGSGSAGSSSRDHGQPAGGRTPEETFSLMNAARAAGDWRAYWDCHAPEAQARLFVVPEMSLITGDKSLQAEFDALRKKHGMTPGRALGIVRTESPEALYPGCDDCRAWFVDFMAFAAAKAKAGEMLEATTGTLSDVRIEGDLATGLITVPSGLTWRRRFIRTSGLWLIGREAPAVVDTGADPAGPTKVLEQAQCEIATHDYEAVYDRIDPRGRDKAIDQIVEICWIIYGRAHRVPEAGEQFCEEMAGLVLGADAPKGSDAQTWSVKPDRFASVKDHRALFAMLARHLDEVAGQPREDWVDGLIPDCLALGTFGEVRIQGLVAHTTLKRRGGFEHPFQLVKREGTWFIEMNR